MNQLFGLYRPGTSPIHRARPGVKLLLLAVFSTALLAWRSPAVALAGAAVVLACYLLAGFGPRTLLGQLHPLRWVLAVLIPYQLWALGPVGAAVMVGTLIITVAAAALLTLTTRTDDLLDAVIFGLTPLSKLGVRTDRIALAAALVIRSIPALVRLASATSDARKARGLERSPRAVLVPFVVRIVRYGQATGDALIARGLDD